MKNKRPVLILSQLPPNWWWILSFIVLPLRFLFLFFFCSTRQKHRVNTRDSNRHDGAIVANNRPVNCNLSPRRWKVREREPAMDVDETILYPRLRLPMNDTKDILRVLTRLFQAIISSLAIALRRLTQRFRSSGNSTLNY